MREGNQADVDVYVCPVTAKIQSYWIRAYFFDPNGLCTTSNQPLETPCIYTEQKDDPFKTLVYRKVIANSSSKGVVHKQGKYKNGNRSKRMFFGFAFVAVYNVIR